MNASELAQKMLEWERLRWELDELEAEIRRAVLDIGKTQTVGNVRATYSAGRKSYDYEAAVNDALAYGDADAADRIEDLITARTKAVVTVDWRSVCADAGIENIPYQQSEPGVTIKLL